MPPAPVKTVRLKILSDPAELPRVRRRTEAVCEQIGFDSDTTGRVMLSVDEALTNVIRHAYGGRPGQPIEIELSPLSGGSRGGLRIRVRDYGRVVDPAKIHSRALDDVRPGGLGVHIITNCMDRVEYAPAEGGGTVLTLTKHLPSDRQDRKT